MSGETGYDEDSGQQVAGEKKQAKPPASSAADH
jgi:hypothetical protein